MTASPDQGVFASTAAVAAQPKEDLLRLTYTTTTASSYTGRQIDKNDRTESFQEIFDVGQRRTKYLGVPLRLAPLLDRSSCNYTMDFAKKPLGDNIQNSHMAKVFKTGAGPPKSLPNLPAGHSTYDEEICIPLTVEERLGARLGPVGKLTATLGPDGSKSVYTTSLAHEIYQAHPMISTSDFRPRDCLQRINTAPAPMNSTYHRDFQAYSTRRDRVRKKGWTWIPETKTDGVTESPHCDSTMQLKSWNPQTWLLKASVWGDLTSLVSPLKEVNRIARRLDVEMLISLTPPRGLWSWKSAYGCICIISLGEPVGLSSWLRRQSSGFLSNQVSLC